MHVVLTKPLCMAVLACGLCVRAGEAVQVKVQAVAAELAKAGALLALALQRCMTPFQSQQLCNALSCKKNANAGVPVQVGVQGVAVQLTGVGASLAVAAEPLVVTLVNMVPQPSCAPAGVAKGADVPAQCVVTPHLSIPVPVSGPSAGLQSIQRGCMRQHHGEGNYASHKALWAMNVHGRGKPQAQAHPCMSSVVLKLAEGWRQ